jgi:hypothetical protein
MAANANAELARATHFTDERGACRLDESEADDLVPSDVISISEAGMRSTVSSGESIRSPVLREVLRRFAKCHYWILHTASPPSLAHSFPFGSLSSIALLTDQRCNICLRPVLRKHSKRPNWAALCLVGDMQCQGRMARQPLPSREERQPDNSSDETNHV